MTPGGTIAVFADRLRMLAVNNPECPTEEAQKRKLNRFLPPEAQSLSYAYDGSGSASFDALVTYLESSSVVKRHFDHLSNGGTHR